MRIAWASLSLHQQGILEGGEPVWDKLDDTAQANYFAITHALEGILVYNDGTPCSAKMVPGTGVMREDGRELNVGWHPDTHEAFKAVGFDYRVGAPWDHHGEAGLIHTPQGAGHGDIQGIHVLFDNTDPTKGDLHIDYDWGLGHFGARNDDVTQNYKKYQRWYGVVPGLSA